MATTKVITVTAYGFTSRAKNALFFDTKLNKIGSSKTEISTFEGKNVLPSPTTLFLKIDKNGLKQKRAQLVEQYNAFIYNIPQLGKIKIKLAF